MILIVADTGPLNYLIQIGCVDLLSELIETVVLPASVLRELKSEKAPSEVREWAKSLPAWVEVKAAGSMMIAKPELSYADCEAISLAKELNALLLMDDRRARRAAADQSVRTLGTLGLLEAASAKGLIQLSVAVERRDTALSGGESVRQTCGPAKIAGPHSRARKIVFPDAAEDFQLVEAEGAVMGKEGIEDRVGGFSENQTGVKDRLVGTQQISLGHGFNELPFHPHLGLNETHQIAEAVEGVAMLIAWLLADDESADKGVAKRRASGGELAAAATEITGLRVKRLSASVHSQQEWTVEGFTTDSHATAGRLANTTIWGADALHQPADLQLE